MSGEKNLPATEARVLKAREEGQVASSQDLMRSAVCLAVFEGCRVIFSRYYQFAGLYFQEFIGQIGLLREGQSFSANNVFVWIIASASVTILLASVAVVVWIAASWVQTGGPVFKKHPIELKLDKLDPTQVFKNIFSAKTVVDAVGNILKATVVALVFGQAVRHALRDAPMVVPAGIEAVAVLIGSEVLGAIRIALIALLCLAVFDFWLQRRLMLRDIKMSFQEVKDEHKEAQGNPEVKQHLRRIGQEVLGEEGATPDPLAGSNALIVNPTHLAVGLRYVKGEKRLPQVRIKASDAAAMDLIETARDLNVPVVRHIWLARTLYELGEGAAIPREAFKAVAAVYRMLFQLDKAAVDAVPKTLGEERSYGPVHSPGSEPPANSTDPGAKPAEPTAAPGAKGPGGVTDERAKPL
ncbi:type III secretion system export apparatus subunit SctU [soil metagenome]